jgi:hypothetical protein
MMPAKSAGLILLKSIGTFSNRRMLWRSNVTCPGSGQDFDLFPPFRCAVRGAISHFAWAVHMMYLR